MTLTAGRTACRRYGSGSGKTTREVVLAAALEIIDTGGPTGCPCAASPAPWAATR